jgi:hypothetical protein
MPPEARCTVLARVRRSHAAGVNGFGNLAEISRSLLPSIEAWVIRRLTHSRKNTRQFVTLLAADGIVALISTSIFNIMHTHSKLLKFSHAGFASKWAFALKACSAGGKGSSVDPLIVSLS